MKGKMFILIGIILGGLTGWLLGYLRLPFVEKNFSFLIGFMACLALVLLGIFLLYIWNKHSLLIKLLSKDSTIKGSKKATKTYTLIWILVSAFILLGGLLNGFLVYKQNKLFSAQTKEQNKRIEQQSELIESIRKGNLIFLMGNVLDKVDDELKNNSKGILSDATIARIAALGYSLKPYRYLEGDSLSEKKFSPERGQLLLALSKMNIDSSSFDKIKLNTSFSNADLRKADLRGADLSGAKLKEADLKEADLRGIDLSGADLSGADLWGVDLKNAILRGADLKRANLRWANLIEADLTEADLKGIDFNDADLRRAILNGADSKWVNFIRTNLSGADLKMVDLKFANLQEANLQEANFSKANIRKTDFSKANMDGIELTKAQVMEENWFEMLEEWKVTGAKEIQKKYKLVRDNTPYSNYLLEKVEN